MTDNMRPGEIPKRPTGADCKSAGKSFAGSNPALPTEERKREIAKVVKRVVAEYGDTLRMLGSNGR